MLGCSFKIQSIKDSQDKPSVKRLSGYRVCVESKNISLFYPSRSKFMISSSYIDSNVRNFAAMLNVMICCRLTTKNHGQPYKGFSQGGKNVVRPRTHPIWSSKTAWDSLEGGKSVVRPRTHPIWSSKSAWDSLEGGKTVVRLKMHPIRSKAAWHSLEGGGSWSIRWGCCQGMY
jgi:hypothetical protein